MAAMEQDLTQVMETFANWGAAWRKDYMDQEEEQKAVLVAIHELHHYSAAWTRALTKSELANDIAALLNSDSVEVHHSTLHAKPPSEGALPNAPGHPFLSSRRRPIY